MDLADCLRLASKGIVSCCVQGGVRAGKSAGAESQGGEIILVNKGKMQENTRSWVVYAGLRG